MNCFEFVYYEDETGAMIYEGDLEKDLIQFGVEPEVVDSVKKRKLQTIPYNKIEIGIESRIKLVPVDKIYGINRKHEDKSIFELIRVINKGYNIKSHKFSGFMAYVKANSVKEMRHAFENLKDPVVIQSG